MRAMLALIKREYLEHRGAFVYAPSVVLAIVSAAVLFVILLGRAEVGQLPGRIPTGAVIYQLGMIGLFFYYADSFSADRRDNALLFWKSMPQSDLKILTAKALSGGTVFLGLIFGFAMLTALLIYLALLLTSARFPVIAAPEFAAAAWSMLQMGVVGAVYLALALLWYAPGLAWVAGLSTLFRRWSIPLAFLIPGTVVLLEYINSIRGTGTGRPIAEFLAWRTDGFIDEAAAAAALLDQTEDGPFALIEVLVSTINWPHMGIGLLFAAMIVYLASEYRRRRIEA